LIFPNDPMVPPDAPLLGQQVRPRLLADLGSEPGSSDEHSFLLLAQIAADSQSRKAADG
jgi:hypothetical protein